MEYNLNIRREIFGGTILNLENGKRAYVTKEELEKIEKDSLFPSDISAIMPEKAVAKVTSSDNYDNFFRFADIAFIELTRGCNLRCKHCLNNSGTPEENQLKMDDFYLLIKQLAEAGVQEIRFTGGEPLIFEGIYDLIRFVTDLGIFVSIGTNGTLITKKVAQKLKDSGLKKAVVSLDGTKEMHDTIRGNGNYDKTINAIKFLQDVGINIKVNSVIMRSNREDVIKLAKQLHNEKIPIFIRRFIESGRGANLKNNMLSKSDYEYVNHCLEEELNNGPYVRGHYIRLIDEGKNSRIKLPFTLRNGCKAGQRALVITPNGDIHFCGFLAAQGFPAIANVRSVNNWTEFWMQMQKENRLENLEKNLDAYNSLPNVQPTNCLAYVQRYLSENKRRRDTKTFYIFVSKHNIYTGQVKKLKGESKMDTQVVCIEDFIQGSEKYDFKKEDVIYFLCCNSAFIPEAIQLLEPFHCKIINQKYLKHHYKKSEIQELLKANDVLIPKIIAEDNMENIKFPVFCKENRHEGIIFQIYNKMTLERFLEKFNREDFYFEDVANADGLPYREIKIYSVNGEAFGKDSAEESKFPITESMKEICKKVSKALNHLEVFSIDIIHTEDNKDYVIDVNPAAGFYLSDAGRKYFLDEVASPCAFLRKEGDLYENASIRNWACHCDRML